MARCLWINGKKEAYAIKYPIISLIEISSGSTRRILEHSRNECQANLCGAKAPLLKDGCKGLEKSKNESITEATQ